MSLRTPPFMAVAIAAVLALSACAPSGLIPSASPTPTSTSASGGAALAFLPDGTAFDNKEFFDSVLQPVAEVTHSAPGRAMVSALVAAGFNKKAIEVSPDLTKTGLEADSVFVSVRIGKLCLIGQRTNSKEYISSVESAMKFNKCLIGNTSK